MPHYAAFHLGRHCLPKYTFMGHKYIKGYSKKNDNIQIALKFSINVSEKSSDKGEGSQVVKETVYTIL